MDTGPAHRRRRGTPQRPARPAGIPVLPGIDAEYRLDRGSGLHVAITATNRGSHAAPYGTGSQPYLTAGMSSVDDCELALPAACWLPTDDRGIPSGHPAAVAGTPHDFRQPRAIGATRLDHALTRLARDRDGRAWAHLAANGGSGTRVGLWAGRGYQWLQVFTGDPLAPERRRKATAIEPMTCLVHPGCQFRRWPVPAGWGRLRCKWSVASPFRWLARQPR